MKHHNISATEKQENAEKEHQEESKRSTMKTIEKTKAVFAFLTALALSSCVYHRRYSDRPHLLQYDHRDAEVVFPWRTSEKFKAEYELAIIASMGIWIAYPAELLEGLSKMDPKRMLSFFPALVYAYSNDVDSVEWLANSASQHRERMRRQENGTKGR